MAIRNNWQILFVSGAAQAGHQVETIALSEIEVKGLPGLQCLPLRKALCTAG